ncbi:alpha/beta fold hydrolase [Pontibacter sp. JH31]|uniref:Alpha/beta fold hydrolase n=1 Tax=Pontibacter aquaedesilientis TaxID=2766980 RepID=A0ABR7XBS6_9BACT|nr:alpha/beta fold hydrolase [Pontibacter aquaedesilientis]MBD1395735.1 alpha/beta fold hydrolase [Pontibacter aquaedesilientis]
MGFLSFQQESLIFFPDKLRPDYQFSFNQEFEEVYIPVEDGIRLHGLYFKAATPKGMVFYLHGNAGSVDLWGWIADTYTNLGYDIFVLDYRGYGKSEGNISSEKQFYGDVQAAYDHLKARYSEAQIVIAGYSIGSAAAAKLAAENKPKLLILQAPYYSLGDLMQSLYPFVPTFLLRYKFETFRYVAQTKAPIAIFHGVLDEIIYPGSSEKLKPHLKPTDKVILLKGQGHNGMNDNPAFQRELARLLKGPE